MPDRIEIWVPEHLYFATQTDDGIQSAKASVEAATRAKVSITSTLKFAAEVELVNQAIQVLVGSHAYSVVQPLIVTIIGMMRGSPMAKDPSNPIASQTVIYINGDHNTVHVEQHNIKEER